MSHEVYCLSYAVGKQLSPTLNHKKWRLRWWWWGKLTWNNIGIHKISLTINEVEVVSERGSTTFVVAVSVAAQMEPLLKSTSRLDFRSQPQYVLQEQESHSKLTQSRTTQACSYHAMLCKYLFSFIRLTVIGRLFPYGNIIIIIIFV